MRSTYATYALAALVFGLSIAFWRSARDNGRLEQIAHAAEMAQLTAEEDAHALRERLRREIKGREFAEAAQTIAENAQNATREKLLLEKKAHADADLARAVAVKNAALTTEKLDHEIAARQGVEAE